MDDLLGPKRPHPRRLCVGACRVECAVGLDNRSRPYAARGRQRSELPKDGDPTKKHQINIDNDTAWVVFDGWSQDHSDAEDLNFETHILKRDAGVWHIVYASAMQHYDPGAADQEISVDETGRVVWASARTLAPLKSPLVLTVSAGRVRARRLEWDKILQKRLAAAGKYHGFFELYHFATETGGPRRYPVVLGDTPDGGVAVVHLSVRDGVTHLRIDADTQIDNRLAVAQAVFGLSDGQMRVGRHIADDAA